MPASIGWMASSTGAGLITNINGCAYYRASFVAESNGFILKILEVEYSPFLSIIEPLGIMVQDAWEISFPEEELGVAGWVGMCLDLYVMPLEVSFSALSIIEVPEYGDGIAPTGYFTANEYSRMWHHTEQTGAGVWRQVRDNNFFMPDAAQIGEPLRITPLSEGRITWCIPTAWGIEEDSGQGMYSSKLFGVPYYQTFEIDADGTLTVTKFNDFWAERGTNGARRVSGNVRRAMW